MSHGAAGQYVNYLGVAKGLSTLYNLKAGFKSKLVTNNAGCGDGTAQGADSDLLAALQWAVLNTPGRIVSLSYGSTVTAPDDDDQFARRVDQMADLNDAFIAISAGNRGGAQTVASPAIGYNIVSVANWDSRGTIAPTSSRGPTNGGRFKPDIAAPGSGILAPNFDWDNPTDTRLFVPKTGTSMAAPHIAGSAALLRQAGVTDPLEMKAILLNSVDETTWAADRGWGYANLTTARAQYTFRDSQTLPPSGNHFYRVNAPSSLVATLTWNRHVAASLFRMNDLDLYAYALSSGALLATSDAYEQNVEKVAVAQTSESLVVRVHSSPLDQMSEFYAIAFSKAFSRANGPLLQVACNQPSTGNLNTAIPGSCTVTNTGDLPLIAPAITITGPNGANTTNLPAIQPSASFQMGTSFTSATTGVKSFNVSVTSASYGATIGGSTNYSITISAAPSAPAAPSNPNPADNATGIATAGTLSWAVASGATSYDVYFGASNPPALLTSNATVTNAAFSGLTPGVTYFWQVVAKNAVGSTPGAVWRFTTAASTGMVFVPIAPCRLVDTRAGNGALAGPALFPDNTRTFPLSTHACVAPASPVAYSLNITVVPQGQLGYLSIWPAGDPLPLVSTLNSLNGQVKANAAIVRAGTSGSVNVYTTNATHAIIDINGYFLTPGAANGLAFYPLTPCRVADTRAAQAPALTAGATRIIAVRSSACGVPSNAQAYALNATVAPLTSSFGYLTVWPAGQNQPVVSTLNAVTGFVTANAAIVPAGSNGDISVFGSDNAHLILDITGYFAPPGAVGALTYRPLTPCRSLDTRPSNALQANTARSVSIANACGVPATAKAYSLNATVLPQQGAFGFLTLWPAGSSQPLVSTLNALDGQIASNAAIVTALAPGGQISVLGSEPAHLILDVSGYFAP
jgi:hypothetical protein